MWIDTACISSIGSVRDQQVLEMDEIYRNAQAIVICDSELASKEGNVLDLLSRAAWNSRVWTLQEAILNPTRFVLTSTGVTQLPKIVVTGQFADVRCASRLWWMHSGRTDYTAQQVYSLLEGRSATVEDDLWIGVAGIVPEVRKALLNRTSSVAQAVSQLLYVDDSMLISNDPRYTQIGLSWMPKPGSSSYRDYTEIYTVNEDGSLDLGEQWTFEIEDPVSTGNGMKQYICASGETIDSTVDLHHGDIFIACGDERAAGWFGFVASPVDNSWRYLGQALYFGPNVDELREIDSLA